MKYFIFTYIGDALPIAYKLQQEGHEVIVGLVQDKKDVHSEKEGAIKPEDELSKKRRLSLYDGMVKKVPAWGLIEDIKKLKSFEDTFVFFDRNNLFKFANHLQDLPVAGNFPTEEDYLLEHDRDEAKQFVKKHYSKLHVAEVHEFAKVSEAVAFLQATDSLWVLKGKADQAKTFVPDIEDAHLASQQIIHRLEDDKDIYEQSGFILELMISSLIEITPERIYYDGELVALTIDIENKPFGSGNTSVQTGCAQDLVFPLPFTERINEIAFPDIVDELAKKHKGLFYWDASLLIDKRNGKIYFGEFCSNRPGYNALFTGLAQCPSTSHYFSQIAKKINPFTMGTVATSVTIFNPDSDYEQGGHPPKDAPIRYKPEIEKDVWLWDARKKGERLVTAGDDWNLAVITGSGKSIDEAVNRMYRNVDDFSFVGGYYRPKFDYVSLEYPSSIPNRLNYGLDRGLFQLPFNVKVGEISAKR